MYFPYLRGKQFELVMLRETAPVMASTNNRIIPIIEPVNKEVAVLKNTLAVLHKNNVRFVLIVNPKEGKFKKDAGFVKEIIESVPEGCEQFYFALIINLETSKAEITRFFEEFKDNKICLIHCHPFEDREHIFEKLKDHEKDTINVFMLEKTSRGYRKAFKGCNGLSVAVRDGFDARDNNKDYPDDAFFDDLHSTYNEMGHDGFGDFLTVGDVFKESGGPAYTIAVHITYINKDEDMYIKHFKSDTQDTPVDPGGKFAEALKKFHDYYAGKENLIYETEAVQEFMSLYSRGHYPGLGFVKKLALKHHIELITKRVFKI